MIGAYEFMSTWPQDMELDFLAQQENSLTKHRSIWLLRPAWILPAIGAVALALFTWGVTVSFETSDQAAMAYLVQHNFGVKWFFAHEYGPVLPVLQRSWGELLTGLGFLLQEWTFRLPIVLLSLIQVGLTYPLMRRLRCSQLEALLGTAFCAVLPEMVSNAHYAWSYLTIRMLCGTIALWATLVFFDTRHQKYLALAGIAVFAHCVSGAYAMALPTTLIAAWAVMLFQNSQPRKEGKPFAINKPLVRSAVTGFVLPCIMAALLIIFCWVWTGRGQIGHLLHKQNMDGAGFCFAQLIEFSKLWIQQLGYLMAILSIGGLLYGIIKLRHGFRPSSSVAFGLGPDSRRSLLLVWCILGVLPVALLVKCENIGYAGYYLFEAVYPATLLVVMGIAALHRRWSKHCRRKTAILFIGGATFLQLAIGSADACLGNGSLQKYTGVNVPWGSIRPDTGIKAAGWYIRRHVPEQAMILSLHTNKGMELPVAEYYCGRKVLAGYELTPAMLPSLVTEFRDRVNVIITPADQAHIVETHTSFQPVFTAMKDGRPVRKIYAPPSSALPVVTREVASLNQAYDRSCLPRQVPTPLPAPKGFLKTLDCYQTFVKRLKNSPVPFEGLAEQTAR